MRRKTDIVGKFQRTDLVICSHSREGKSVLYPNKQMKENRYLCI